MSTAAAVEPDDILAPGPIDPTETVRFSSRDGTGLYGEWFTPEAPKAAALIVHGYAEHCGCYREVAHVLVRAGVAALAYDMRGHGRAAGQRGYVNDYSDYLDDMEAALEELDKHLRRMDPGAALPRLLLGHSNGGLIVLRALADPERRPAQLKAAVVSSPFLRLHPSVSLPKRLIAVGLGRWLPRLSLPSDIDPEQLTSDPRKQAERRLDTLCHDVANARWFVAAQDAQDYVATHGSRIHLPTQWLVAQSDRLADPNASRVVRTRLRTKPEYHSLEGFLHEVFNETDRAHVFALLTAFVKGKVMTNTK
jgi:alpha-beta hydrolase superfamily lysophospholipase